MVTPPQGHWNRVHAGRTAAPPKPRARHPGETGRISLDRRFRGHVAEVGPMPEAGPFASGEVPEDLAALRTQELAKIGKAAALRDLSRPPAGLARLLRKEEARRAKAAASRWHWDEPHFDTPLGQRQLQAGNLGIGVCSAIDDHVAERFRQAHEIALGVDHDLLIHASALLKQPAQQMRFTRTAVPLHEQPGGKKLFDVEVDRGSGGVGTENDLTVHDRGLAA